MATKTKKKKAPVTTDYGKAKAMADKIKLLEEHYVDDYADRRLFARYLRDFGKLRGMEFLTKLKGERLLVVRIK